MKHNAQLDHLVVHADSLAQGDAWARQMFGVEPQSGGRHAAMGTHNLLLRIGTAVYLEIIALDPDAPAPARARWFEMDRPERRASAARTPRLIHFVARYNDLAQSSALIGLAPSEMLDMARGEFRWRIGVPADGALRDSGLAPTLIEWQGARPVERMPASGVELLSLSARHPEAARIEALYRALGLAGIAVEPGAEARLVARFSTPNGLVEL
jgi:hypothetical protein